MAAMFVAAHLPFLPQSLEDVDSINFALGLRHFDPALHQPHPPGYPLYIGLGHLSLTALSWLVPALPELRVEAVALAVWSLAGGAVAIVAAAMLFRALEDACPDEATQVSPFVVPAAAALLAVAPLFSISGVRPLSDMPGLALTLLAQALIVRGLRSTRALVAGALLAGLAGGIRVQSGALTIPLFVGVLVAARHRHTGRDRALAVFAGVAGGLAWAAPLVILSGGPQGYLRALQSQAGEDFAWVDMLWSQPTPRLLALALYRTLGLSWGDPRLGLLMAGLAAAGTLAAWLRTRRMLALAALAFVPYAAFHLLLQETATIRYALPLVPPVVWLATLAMQQAGRVAPVLWLTVTVSAALVSASTAIDYGQQAHPAFRAIVDMISEGEGSPPAGVYSHHALYRSLQAAAPAWLNPVAPVRQKEWLGPVEYFRGGGTRTVWFLADPLRTDMALFDPANVLTNEANPWRAWAHAEIGGVRPVGAVWHRLQPPGWMVGEGWSLTPEAGGRVRAARTGLDHGPIAAYVRRRTAPATLLIGGFHLGTTADAAAQITVTLDGATVDTWTVAREEAGTPFVRFVPLPDGVPGGAGPYATLRVAARSREAGRAVPEIAIRQFDVQPSGGRPLMAFANGWYEDEYSPETGQRWRWTGANAQLRLVSSQSAVLRVRGESPLKYLDAPPTVRVMAGSRTLATFQPSTDFSWTVNVPADALTEARGVVTIETDRTYVPSEVEGSSDVRHLGLRIFDCRADLQ
jgi:hypothetical protein